jgi:NAD(P)-binding Rossmann-like domain
MGSGSNNVKKRTRIVAFGGGISTLAALFDLTSKSDWKDQYDINVYQMGWRLGGKGASSRNPAFNDRIEEHGLHIWLGFYENAFPDHSALLCRIGGQGRRVRFLERRLQASQLCRINGEARARVVAVGS